MRVTFNNLKERIKITNSICKSNLVVSNGNGYTNVDLKVNDVGGIQRIFSGTNREVYEFLCGLEYFYSYTEKAKEAK